MYLTYEDYLSLGGTTSESTFNVLIKRSQMKIDYLTNGRIKNLDEVPDEVKELLVRLVDLFSKVNVDKDPSLTSYSNGIESFGYSTSNDGTGITLLDKQIIQLTNEYLYNYPELLNRGKWQWKQK